MTKKKTSVVLDDETLETLDEMADETERSRSGMLRHLLREERRKRETAKKVKETQDDSKD